MEGIIKIYNVAEFTNLIQGIKVVQISKNENEEKIHAPSILPQEIQELNISETMSCSFCKITFDDNVQQRQHYKKDWHRYNLKQNLKLLEPISEDKFQELADDVSSISGSDSEKEDNSEIEKNFAVNQGKIFFQNNTGRVFALYKCLLYEKKEEPKTEDKILSIVRNCSKNNYWTILMLGGGHFAGAVYNGSEVLVHKTFHCYTVRAKQGGSQGSRDNRSGTSHPKSAGASLRRYNEQALVQHVTEILSTWAPHIEKSNLILYRAAGPYNRSVLFGSKNPILKKNDGRLRVIPFSTRRPTYTELQRVFNVLTSIEVYGSLDIIKDQFGIDKSNEQNQHQSRPKDSPKNKNINRAKSRELKERPSPQSQPELSSDTSDDEDNILITEETEISFKDLQQFDDTVPQELKKRQTVKKKKPKKKERSKIKADLIKKQLYTTCSEGNLEGLKLFVDNTREILKDEPAEVVEILNGVIDEHGNTALHIASLCGKRDVIIWLMENDTSPCNKNDKQQTPYTITSDKAIRNVFRNFAAENPEKYNYGKAQIPLVTLTEEQIAEKKKALKKIKREREKEKKKENDMKKKEQDDKERFLNLSDREKRALAAERRILSQNKTVLVRCFLCGEDISGKVPFEYSGNRFCTITCLKAHRLKNTNILS